MASVGTHCWVPVPLTLKGGVDLLAASMHPTQSVAAIHRNPQYPRNLRRLHDHRERKSAGSSPVAIDRVVERDGRLADLDLFDPRQHRFEDGGHFELGEMPTEAHVDTGAGNRGDAAGRG